MDALKPQPFIYCFGRLHVDSTGVLQKQCTYNFFKDGITYLTNYICVHYVITEKNYDVFFIIQTK